MAKNSVIFVVFVNNSLSSKKLINILLNKILSNYKVAALNLSKNVL